MTLVLIKSLIEALDRTGVKYDTLLKTFSLVYQTADFLRQSASAAQAGLELLGLSHSPASASLWLDCRSTPPGTA